MISKYFLNQILAFITCSFFIGIFFWLINNQNANLSQSFFAMIALILCEHYLLNLIHIASHRSLSKNSKINDLIGNFIAVLTGISLPVFRETHNLHHANPNNPSKDPDHFISTRGQLWWIAGRIFYHDYYFFKYGLYKRKGNLKTYIAGRMFQVCLVLLFVSNNKLNVWIYFWLPSILIIGTLYGYFQFYFPHYSTKVIDKWRVIDHQNIIQKACLFLIDFSRYYHFKHHEQIKNNTYYFPFYTFLRDRAILKQSFNEELSHINY